MGCVFAIEEFATFDGPGIRTTVFLKGCPLSCSWCHNPEGQNPDPEYVRSPNGCTHCGACVRAGETDASGRHRLTADSVSACPQNLVRLCGIEYTADELADKLLKNAEILAQNGGGVTFSGGEPLYNGKFLAEVMRRLQGRVHMAVQTSGFAAAECFKEILALTDYVLYDLKVMDRAESIRYCGVDNTPILRNYRTLCASGKPFVTRVPLIPGVTDTESNLSAIAAFMRDNGVTYVETLPYNQMAGSKYPMVMRAYAPDFDVTRPLNDGEAIFKTRGIRCKSM